MEIRKVPNRPLQASLRAAAHVVLWQKRLREWLRPPPPPRVPERIALFASMELLGGGVMISAMVKTLRQLYPQARIQVVGEQHRTAKLEEFFTRHSWVDGVIVCPRRGSTSLGEWWRFYRRLRAERLDLCVLSPNHSCSNSVFLYLCGVPRILAADLPRTWVWHANVEHRFLTERMTTEQIGQEPYRQLYFPQAYARAMTGRNDLRLTELIPYVRFEDEGLPPLPAHKPVVVLHPGGHPEKRWRADGFAAVAGLLVERYDAALLLIGGPPERELCEALRAQVLAGHPRADVVNCAGATMNRTLSCLAHAALFVGNNAGPMHLATALGVPVVGVFREIDRWFAGPDAIDPRHHTVGADPVEAVTVEAVWEAITTHWPGRDARTPAREPASVGP